MVKYKSLLIISLVFLFGQFACYSQEQDHSIIWGVWNQGPTEGAIYNSTLDNQLYASTVYSLKFNPHFGNTGKMVLMDWSVIGQIIEINGKYPDFFVTFLLSHGDLAAGNIYWKLQVHFVNIDEIWILLLEENGEKVKPENHLVFHGIKDGTFWRAKKIKEPLPEVY